MTSARGLTDLRTAMVAITDFASAAHAGVGLAPQVCGALCANFPACWFKCLETRQLRDRPVPMFSDAPALQRMCELVLWYLRCTCNLVVTAL